MIRPRMLPYHVEFNLVDIKNPDWGSPNLQLYQIQLSDFDNAISELEVLLAPEERNRANRYRFKKDKYRFIICRGLLKKLLSGISHCAVSEIILSKDKNGKPYLLDHPELFFNISHTNDLAFIAIGSTPIGIDVEFIDPNFDYGTIMTNTLNNQELDILANSKNPRATFFTFWTRKEAFVKATGQGIGDNFKSLNVSESSVAYIDPAKKSKMHFRILSFAPKMDYVASLAIWEGQKVQMPLNVWKLGPKTCFQ